MSNAAGTKKYMFVSEFPEYKKEIEKHKETSNNFRVDFCNQNRADYLSYIKEEDDNICLTTTRYLKHVSSLGKDNIVESRCKYLYYWLYYDYLQGNEDFEKTNNLYNAFFDISSDYNESIEEKHNGKINEDGLKKFKALDDMYGNLNKIKEKTRESQDDIICKCATDCSNEYMKYQTIGSTLNDDNFFDEIENIREPYNTLIKTVNNCNEAKQLLPSFKPTFPILPVLIYVVTALVILFFLLILYKINYKFTS